MKCRGFMSENINEIANLLYLINRKINNQIGEQFAPLNITSTQAKIIYEIYHHSVNTICDLTITLGLTYPNCSNILKRMENSGLLKREKLEDNRRFTKVTLTKKSLEIIDDITHRLNEMNDFYKSLDKESYNKVLEGLTILNETLGGK